MTKPFHSSYWIAGALSGAVWFFVAIGLDNDWAIPKSSWSFLAAIVFAGIMTGEVISVVFRRAFSKKSKVLFFMLPLVTLPIAIALFAVLVWLMRQSLGVRFQAAISPLAELRLIVETYLIVLLTIFAPFLYGLALLNQSVMRAILKKQKPNKRTDNSGAAPLRV
ncbi:MAG: hypothetical protein HY302_16745 [Opitutae bacterium]|nr:hypothetical protein [Opitutae bacterium]